MWRTASIRTLRRRTNNVVSRYFSSDIFEPVKLPYKGARINFADFPDESQQALEDGGAAFVAKLQRSIDALVESGRKSVWLDVPAQDAALAAFAARDLGFEFHHAEGQKCVLKKWICTEDPDTIPTPLATHQVGCAGLVTNDRDELLVIKERNRHNGIPLHWKLPGGMLDRGEDIEDAVTREVWEETGVETKFDSVLSFWNRHHLPPWGQSDIYIVAKLEAVDSEAPIVIDPLEISESKWMCMEEFAATEEHPLILRLLERYFGITKDGRQANVPASPDVSGFERIDVQWPNRPLCPTYIAKGRSATLADQNA